MKKKALGAVIITLLFLAFYASNLLRDAGLYYEPSNNFGGKICERIGEMQGPEDISQLGSDIFISSNFHRPAFDPAPKSGALYVLQNGSGEVTKPKKLILPEGVVIYPHGIDSIPYEGGALLAVINHLPKRDVIDFFHYKAESLDLDHISRVSTPEDTHGLNDVALVSKDYFYVTQEYSTDNKLLRLLQTYSRIGTGQVLMFRRGDVQLAASGFSFANGLSLDRNKNELYVAEMLGKKVHRFKIDESKDNRSNLSLIQSWSLLSAPDNLYFDARSSELWVVTHPNLFRLKDHSEAPSHSSSPFEVQVFEPHKMGEDKVMIGLADMTARYTHDGATYSGASVALPLGGGILLGQIYGKGLIYCHEKHSSD